MNLELNNQEVPRSPDQYHLITGVLASVAVVLISLVFFVFTDTRFPDTLPQTAAVASVDLFAPLSLEAHAVVVQDITSGKILYARNADQQLALASLTKVPLAFVVAESLPLTTPLVLSEAIPAPVTANGILKGTEMTLEELLDYTLVASSNEGAEYLATTADSAIRTRFPDAPEGLAALWRMNMLAKERGLSHTFFRNVSGLDVDTNASGAYGTARDIALLFGYIAQARPDVFARTTDTRFALGTIAVGNTNDALSAIPGLIMGKTGFTDLAGGNLTVVFDAGPTRPIVIVVLGSTKEGRFSDMKKLVEATRRTLAQ